MKFRPTHAARLPADSAKRQGKVTHLAFLLLGRDAAIEFLNSDNAALGARPIDLAIASNGGLASVEAELGRMTFRTGGET